MGASVRVSMVSLLALTSASGCSGSGSSKPSPSEQAAYVSDMRTMEKNLGGTHLTDQQLVALAKNICKGLESGHSREAELAYATGRVGVPLATTVYTESVHVYCPNHEG